MCIILFVRSVSMQAKRAIGKQVFLGGSCNPTTWRKDTAVPALEKAGITFFNPQAGAWSKEMIALEEKEKRESRLQLFVIDNQTRSISSMVETAYLSASGHEIVAVINDFQLGAQIGEHVLTTDEVHDLNSGHDSLRDVLHREQVPLFSSIPMALLHIVELLKKNRSINVLAEEDFVQAMPVRTTPTFQYGGMVATMANIFTTKDKRIHVDHLPRLMNSRLFGMGLKVSEDELVQLLAEVRAYMQLQDRPDVGFAEFAGLVLELNPSSERHLHTQTQRETSRGAGSEPEAVDIFLRGVSKCEVSRESLNKIKTMFRSKECTFVQPSHDQAYGCGGSVDDDAGGGSGSGSGSDSDSDSCGDGNTASLETLFDKSAGRSLGAMLTATDELTTWDSCSVLLFNISSHRRAIDKCIEAAHAIGVGQRPVVLCMDPDAGANLKNAGGKPLEAREIKDLSRGRHYLEDIAKRHGVFISSNLEEAAIEAIRLSKGIT